MSSMRDASRPISAGTTWSVRYDATASSRPLSVASPMPWTPASVSIFSVTKLRPGQVTMTRQAVIFMGCANMPRTTGGRMRAESRSSGRTT